MFCGEKMVSVEVITPYLMVQQLSVIQLHLGDHVVLQKQQDGVEYLMTIAHVMVVQIIELAAMEQVPEEAVTFCGEKMVSVEVITPYLTVQPLNVIQLHLGDHVVLQKQQDGVEYL